VDPIEKARRVFALEIDELNSLSARLDQPFVDAIDALLRSLEDGGKILVAGVGKCSHIAEKVAATFTSTGSPAVALHSVNLLHGDMGIVQQGDVALLMSYSGETDELLRLIDPLKNFGVTLISITGNPRSSLARSSDIVIESTVTREACPLYLAPTSSTTSMLVLGDALGMVLLEARGFERQDFAKFHPGGTLGRRLLMKAREMMRDMDELVLVAVGTTVDEVVDKMGQRKTGAALVLDDDGRLAGFFTHGDFVRAYRNYESSVGSLKVEELMTKDPIVVDANTSAADVLVILGEHRIDEIVVVDADGLPLGLIDSQDISRLKLV